MCFVCLFIQVSGGEAVALIVIPLLFLLLWLLAVMFMAYDRHLRRYLKKIVLKLLIVRTEFG